MSSDGYQYSLPTIRAAVPLVLAKGHGQPCSAGAQAFASLVPPTARFQLALDTLLPILEKSEESTTNRILAAYILFALYAPHPISINPFAPTLRDVFARERHSVISATGPTAANTSRHQLVWGLWQILRGDGDDLSPYTPSTLAKSTLPPEFQPEKLTLDDDALHEHPFTNGSWTRKHVDHALKDIEPGSVEADARLERFSQGASLLLAARSRVLTLSEMRTLTPLLPELTSPPLLTSLDLPPLASQNPGLAHTIIVKSLQNSDPTSPTSPDPPNSTGLSSSTATGLAPPTLLSARDTALAYLHALTTLPPTLTSFDLLGRLLIDTTPVSDPCIPPPFSTPIIQSTERTVGDITRTEVLGLFLAHSIAALDRADEDERAGLVSDDRFAVGVQHLCRFFTALLHRGLVDPRDDADTAPMAAFALRHARLAAANALYAILAGNGLGNQMGG